MNEPDTAGQGLVRAGSRLMAARGSVFAAFNDADYGITTDQIEELLGGTPGFLSLPESIRGKVAGLVIGTAMIVAEADRVEREEER